MAERSSETYLAGRISEALAQDPELAELHVGVTISGGRIFLTGPVSTPERRERVAEVAARVARDHEICNETSVADMDEPKQAEELP